MKKAWAAASGLLIFFLLSPFYLAQQIWSRWISHDHPLSSSLVFREVYAEVLSSVEEALHLFMPDAVDITEESKTLTPQQASQISEEAGVILDPVWNTAYRFYIGHSAEGIIGYAVRDTVPGKWGPIFYMVSISPEGTILDVMVLEYQEQRGRPVAKNRFLKQFRGKNVEDDIRVMKDIRGVTGASISSNGMANGIRKIIHVFNLFYGNQ